MAKDAVNNNSALIWSVAELLRGDLKQSEYQKVVLPFTVLRRLDAVLTPKKAEFLTAIEKFEGMEGKETGYVSTARRIYGHEFYNSSPLDFKRLLDDRLCSGLSRHGDKPGERKRRDTEADSRRSQVSGGVAAIRRPQRLRHSEE